MYLVIHVLLSKEKLIARLQFAKINHSLALNKSSVKVIITYSSISYVFIQPA